MTFKIIDIMGISETHWTGPRENATDRRNHHLLWKRWRQSYGRSRYTDVSKSPVGLAPISERIIQARFSSQHIELHIYAPTEEADEQVKEEWDCKMYETTGTNMVCWSSLKTWMLRSEKKTGIMIKWWISMGWDSEMKMKMCEFCDMNELVITGTLFPHIRI